MENRYVKGTSRGRTEADGRRGEEGNNQNSTAPLTSENTLADLSQGIRPISYFPVVCLRNSFYKLLIL